VIHRFVKVIHGFVKVIHGFVKVSLIKDKYYFASS